MFHGSLREFGNIAWGFKDSPLATATKNATYRRLIAIVNRESEVKTILLRSGKGTSN